jgi:hypothetical protein
MVLATSWPIGFSIAALTDGGVHRAAIEANRCVLGHGYDTYFDKPGLRADDPAFEGIRRCFQESEGAEALRSWVIPAGVFAAAGISRWMLPRWRIRRRRLVLRIPLMGTGELPAALTGAVREAGLGTAPAFFVAPCSRSVGAASAVSAIVRWGTLNGQAAAPPMNTADQPGECHT